MNQPRQDTPQIVTEAIVEPRNIKHELPLPARPVLKASFTFSQPPVNTLSIKRIEKHCCLLGGSRAGFWGQQSQMDGNGNGCNLYSAF